jgi:cathepsin X
LDRVSCRVTPVTSCGSRMSISSVLNSEVIRTVQHSHASLSTLADPIKIARKAQGDDIHLSIQYILYCGSEAGSCHGGSMLKTYKFIHETGFIPFDTSQPYLVCLKESQEGFCPYVLDTTCSPMNICSRTCTPGTGECAEINVFPNATVAEYGKYKQSDLTAIKQAEVFERGPVVAGVWGALLLDYSGGVFADLDTPRNTTHAVSIVGWGKDDDTGKQHWIVRNSWGEYWGENMGFFRVLLGENVLGIESEVVWATHLEYFRIRITHVPKMEVTVGRPMRKPDGLLRQELE